MATVQNLVQRKAALGAEQRRRRRMLAPGAVGAAEAVADRLIGAFRSPAGAAISGCWPLLPHVPADPQDRLDAVVAEPAVHRCSALDAGAAAALRTAGA